MEKDDYDVSWLISGRHHTKVLSSKPSLHKTPSLREVTPVISFLNILLFPFLFWQVFDFPLLTCLLWNNVNITFNLPGKPASAFKRLNWWDLNCRIVHILYIICCIVLPKKNIKNQWLCLSWRSTFYLVY